MDTHNTPTSFSTENLLRLLDMIKKCITQEQLSMDTQEHVWDSLTWNKNDSDNKELVKYLFTGWWIHQHTEST